MPSLVIAVPTGGNPFAQCVEQLQRVVAANGLPEIHYAIHGTSAAESKCRAVKWFLQERSEDYLLIVDHDVLVPDNILDLARHGKDIVGGVYYIFRPTDANLPFPGVFERHSDGQYKPIANVFARRGLVRCDGLVGGALCIHRRVLEKVRPAFAFRFDEWGCMNMTEDFDFCEKAKAAGFDVWADFDVACEHLQRIGYRFLMQTMHQSLAQHLRKVAA